MLARTAVAGLAAFALLVPSIALAAPPLKMADTTQSLGGFGIGHSWIMGQFDEQPNQMLDLADFQRTTLAAFRALTGGADVLTAAGLDRIAAAIEDNASSAYRRSLDKMDLNADGSVSEGEVRTAVLATPSRFDEDYRIRRTMEADRDENGMIDLKESQLAAQDSAKSIAKNAKAAYQLMSLDSDADGVITTTEIVIATERVFVFVDTNKDGFADASEICIGRGPLVDRRGLRFGIKTCF